VDSSILELEYAQLLYLPVAVLSETLIDVHPESLTVTLFSTTGVYPGFDT
jgi:hypothetical protein